jgi:hypothetical protein
MTREMIFTTLEVQVAGSGTPDADVQGIGEHQLLYRWSRHP